MMSSDAIAVTHALAGRMRLRAPAIYRRPRLAAELEARALRAAGVLGVEVDSTTATVLVRFAEDTRAAVVIDSIAELLGEIQDAARRSPATSAEPRPGARLAACTSALSSALRRTERGAEAMPRAYGPAFREEQPRRDWPRMDAAEVLATLQSGEDGLTAARARERRERYGLNALPLPEPRRGMAIFLEQLESVPVALLAGSAVVSLATGGVADAIAIIVVIVANATIGYVTESGAERTIVALERPAHLTAPVFREGSRIEVDATELVPGDVVFLGSGMAVAADMRLLSTDDLMIDESTLTGESAPVEKSAAQLTVSGHIPIAEHFDMAYRGTIVTGGRGIGIVVATGAATEIGRIQSMAGALERPATPMQLQLARLGTQLALAAGGACAGVFVIGWIRGYPLVRMLQTALSLAVAAVPEGLPTVATTTLALGIRRMSRSGVLVRRLDAIEALGAVEVFCFDKTGTVTENRMSVVEVQLGSRRLLAKDDVLYEGDERATVEPGSELEMLLRVLLLCSTMTSSPEQETTGAPAVGEAVDPAAPVEPRTAGAAGVLRGSPTEVALARVAIAAGLSAEELRTRFPRTRLRERSKGRMWMDTLHADGEGVLLAVKGSPVDVLALCSRIRHDGDERSLDDEDWARVNADNDRMAGDALRVLGVAYARDEGAIERRDLVWLGLVGMTDPPRSGVAASLARLHSAGVATAMLTGDQSATAMAIGRRIGLTRDGRLSALDSTALEELPADVLRSLVQRVQVFSRVSPAHKLAIVQALQGTGLVVAMTGDGVNDSPALKAADVGVAMGGAGTPAAREVAAIVLRDDDLAMLVTAIEQGRAIHDDIKKAVHFIVATNLGEMLLTAMQVGLGLGTTLSPIQLLWINLLTDVLPELALAVQPPESSVLERPPIPKGRPMFDRRELSTIALEGGVITSGALGAFAWRAARGPRANAGTVAFATLTCAQLLHAISARSTEHTIYDVGRPLARNPYVPLSIAATSGMQVIGDLLPRARRLLGTVPLSWRDWALVGVGSVLPLLVNEALKLVRRGATHEPDGADRQRYPQLAAPHMKEVRDA